MTRKNAKNTKKHQPAVASSALLEELVKMCNRVDEIMESEAIWQDRPITESLRFGLEMA